MFSDGFDAAVNKVVMWLCKLPPEQFPELDFDDFEKEMYK